jgi:hypothetical protein
MLRMACGGRRNVPRAATINADSAAGRDRGDIVQHQATAADPGGQATYNNFQPHVRRPFGIDWPALLRKLDQIDPGFRDRLNRRTALYRPSPWSPAAAGPRRDIVPSPTLAQPAWWCWASPIPGSLWLNIWMRDFFNALEKRDLAQLFGCWILAVIVVSAKASVAIQLPSARLRSV